MYKPADNGISRRRFLEIIGGGSILTLAASGCLPNLPTTEQLNPEELRSKVLYYHYSSWQSTTNPERGGAELTARFAGSYPWQEWHIIDGVTTKNLGIKGNPKYNNVPDYIRIYTVGLDRLHREVEGETIAKLRWEDVISGQYGDFYRRIRDNFVGIEVDGFRKLVSGRMDELHEDKTDFTTTLKVRGENANFSISYGISDATNLRYPFILPITVKVWRADLRDALNRQGLYPTIYMAEASPRRHGAKREADSPISYTGTESFKSGGGHPINIYRDMSPWTQKLIGDLVVVAVRASGKSMDDILEEIKQQEERKALWFEQRRGK